MIVRDFNELKKTDRAVSDAHWTSVRMLLADDKMGFSFHITTLEGGSEHTFEYKNHFESVYCMSGRGSITELGTGETHEIPAGCHVRAQPPRPAHASCRGGAGHGVLLQPAGDRNGSASGRRVLRRSSARDGERLTLGNASSGAG